MHTGAFAQLEANSSQVRRSVASTLHLSRRTRPCALLISVSQADLLPDSSWDMRVQPFGHRACRALENHDFPEPGSPTRTNKSLSWPNDPSISKEQGGGSDGTSGNTDPRVQIVLHHFETNDSCWAVSMLPGLIARRAEMASLADISG
jgi:hypothetical protein